MIRVVQRAVTLSPRKSRFSSVLTPHHAQLNRPSSRHQREQWLILEMGLNPELFLSRSPSSSARLTENMTHHSYFGSGGPCLCYEQSEACMVQQSFSLSVRERGGPGSFSAIRESSLRRGCAASATVRLFFPYAAAAALSSKWA